MIILAFETASPSGGVALLRDGLVEGEMRLNNSQIHSRKCLAFAQELLAGTGRTWRDVDLFAASRGPGSFTGIRVGLTAVKALAWSLGRNVVAVSSLEALATAASVELHPEEIVTALLDARLDEVYGASFRRTRQGDLEPVRPERVLKPDDLPSEVPAGSLLCGEGAVRYYATHLKGVGRLARADLLRASPSATGWLAWRKALAGKTITPHDVSAHYLREAATTLPKARGGTASAGKG